MQPLGPCKKSGYCESSWLRETSGWKRGHVCVGVLRNNSNELSLQDSNVSKDVTNQPRPQSLNIPSCSSLPSSGPDTVEQRQDTSTFLAWIPTPENPESMSMIKCSFYATKFLVVCCTVPDIWKHCIFVVSSLKYFLVFWCDFFFDSWVILSDILGFSR